jgi:hypothetical protein
LAWNSGLIAHLATTPAPVADGDVTLAIHETLRDADLLPGKHMADTAYVDAELLADSRREYGVGLIGPTRPDYRWQSRAAMGSRRAISRSTGIRSTRLAPRARPVSVGRRRWTAATTT